MTPRVMGILNCTPDSFYDGGQYSNLHEQGLKLIADGADIIDIGGESTRPGAQPVSIKEELSRVIPLVRSLSPLIKVSIDTTKPEVASAAADSGATILNDVRGLQDHQMQAISERFHSTIIMHSRGTPQTMTKMTQYSDVTQSVKAWLKLQISLARSPEVILDPGIGFAKSAKQSLILLREIAQLKDLGCPILIGASRKSFIGHTLNQPNPHERLSGSLASVASAFSKGANIFRVHDVRETRDVVDLLWAIENTFV